MTIIAPISMELGLLNKEVSVYSLHSLSDLDGSKSEEENLIYALG
jgi:hypothetical protein